MMQNHGEAISAEWASSRHHEHQSPARHHRAGFLLSHTLTANGAATLTLNGG
jgi:hypothetical protein